MVQRTAKQTSMCRRQLIAVPRQTDEVTAQVGFAEKRASNCLVRRRVETVLWLRPAAFFTQHIVAALSPVAKAPAPINSPHVIKNNIQ